MGIIAGNGLLPISLANNLTQQGKQCYIAILSEEADLALYKNFSYQIFKMGMVGSIIEYFRGHNVKDLVLAGGIKRLRLNSMKVDLTGSILVARLLKQKFLGDDKLLNIVTAFLEEKGFNIVASQEILRAKDKIITTQIPSKQDVIDIELGIKLLDKIGFMDVGQSVIVEDGYILGIEAAEGTDNLIARCATLRKKPIGAVLVKMMKKGQDTRIDMPTIGPDTIRNLAKYRYNGLAIQKDLVIVIETELVSKLANQYGLFVHMIT